MKKLILYTIIVSVSLLAINQALNAFGGRGGGGRGGFGGGRGDLGGPEGGFEGGRGDLGGANAWDRSPSMARTYRPTTAGYGERGVARPGEYPAAGRPLQPDRGQAGFEGTRAATQNQVQQFLRTSPASNMAVTPLEQAKLPLDNRTVTGNAIRDTIGNNFPARDSLYNNNFWRGYGSYYPVAVNADWRRPASWYGVANWLAAPIYAAPLYYDNGYGYPQEGYTYPQNGNGGAQAQPYQQPAQQQPADSSTASQQDGEWMPLGVFALTTEAKNAPTPNTYLQLALNKSGAIGGNLYVKASDKTYPLVGQVDPKTQRAVWKISGSEDSPYVETGLYNLTKNETPVHITFADGRTQNAFLVRLEKGKNSTPQ